MSIPEFYAQDRAAWRNWLLKNHEKESAVWLIFDKGTNRTLKWEDIVQEELCFGWIDSTAGKVSEKQSKIYVSRRKKSSAWSKINKAHVQELIANKLMTPAGLKVIQEAKANGNWDALNKSDNLELPPELVQEFKKNAKAKANFEAFSPSSKRVILSWIYSAKTDVTRQKRVSETVTQAGLGLKAYPKEK